MISGTIVYDSKCHQVHMFPLCEIYVKPYERMPPAPLYLVNGKYEYGCWLCWNGLGEKHTNGPGCDLGQFDLEEYSEIAKEKEHISILNSQGIR